jgi:pyrroline-5-carboxylate reductase
MTTRALLVIIGGGTMARAIILGAMDAKLLSPREIIVVEPDTAKRKQLGSWGVHVTADAAEAIRSLMPPPNVQPREARTHRAPTGDVPTDAADLIAALNPRSYDDSSETGLAAHGGQILLAIKPQTLSEAAAQLRPAIAERSNEFGPSVVMSILAGTPIAKIHAALTAPNQLSLAALPIVRVMPNTPARLRKSMTAISAADGVSASQAQFAFDLFSSLGEVVKIKEELMDAFTALAGSGPAYVFYLAEAMMKAATHVGFDRITADRVVRQTITGAAALLAESTEPPEALRSAVTSKGGTTEAACTSLDSRAVMDAVIAAVEAGRDRGRELAG